ncbi:T brachyury transcription factor [Brachionus plicatilis]|uniref:T brachyury transcription factor n=1 Tax=Brachionus plicatilis TaxID=10195 RepID=A0A3M7PGU3_BRAPC|nr:T brachyury transcription factor [Brachionus plicatilis]
MLSNSNYSINTLTSTNTQPNTDTNIQPENMKYQNYPVCYTVQNMVPQNIYGQSNISIDLEEKELWTRFYHLTNEMILTKAGRRTFPLIRIKMSGLDESSLYTVQIEFRLSDNLKYRFVNGEWKTSPRNDNFKTAQPAIVYEHCDSPNFGHHWSKDSVAFAKLKLTNNENTKNLDAVFLKSLHKYDPIIHVYRHDKKNVDDKVLVFSKFFKETQFIAVTAYQNEQITNLKIKHNPFAKAFLNNKPMITIENDKVVTCEAIKKEQPSVNSANNGSVSKLNNFSVQNAILTQKNNQPKTSTIQNPYYNTSSFNYQYPTQPLYQSFYETYYNPAIYQNYNYAQYSHFNNAYQNQYYNAENSTQSYYPFSNDFNHLLEQNVVYPNERAKQSSPIYESEYQGDAGKRKSAEYETRPAKRQACANDLTQSPAYKVTKSEFEQSDDSLNSTENFFAHISNQTNHSSTSFTLSSSNGSF